MNARDLAEDVPADLMAGIEAQRTVSARTLVEGVAALAAVIGWVWWLDRAAADHHHRTALWLGLVPIIVLDVVFLANKRLRPQEAHALSTVGQVGLWTSVAGLAVLTAFAVQRDGAAFGVLVGLGNVLPLAALLGRCGRWLSRQAQVVRDRAGRLRLSPDDAAESSADRAAWAAANNDWRMGEGPLRRWFDLRPQSTLDAARVVPAASGVDALVGLETLLWAFRVGPGVERILEDGRVVVSRPLLQRSDGLVLLSIDDRLLSVRGSARWFRRRFDWRRHAATVIAADPAYWWNGHPRPGIALIPPPAASAWSDEENAQNPVGLPHRLLDDLAALEPGLCTEPDPTMPRDPGARLWLPARPDRVVVATVLPAELGPADLLVRCEALGLVTLLSLRPRARAATLVSLAALLRGEEEAVERMVHVDSGGGGDHRTVPVHTGPARDRLPVLARGLQFGETVVWWPPQRPQAR